ncbi:MAG: AAA family ATPase [Planctomycetes bacterium]|nr:AAA family ATPase [Planctomycetota bacterium]
MHFTHVRLTNWRNFRDVDVRLGERVFIVGPNASGKSNLLDAFRFLKEVAEPGGGLARAIAHPSRRDVRQIRSLHARANSAIEIDVNAILADDSRWRYVLRFTRDQRRPFFVAREEVWRDDTRIVARPDEDDISDRDRLSQTHLEQVSRNQQFRALAEFLASARYLHVIPQLVREPERSVGRERDPFGGDFLEQLARTPKKQLDSRLRKIRDALRVAVPQLKTLELERDSATGTPHLKGLYEHWRPNAGWQNEAQFSDGTLRLLGLLWSFLDGDSPLLLEEPELSLHAAVVRNIPQMLHRLNRRRHRQIMLSTHSQDLLSDEGIGAEEVLLLEPGDEGTRVLVAAEDEQVRILLEEGAPLSELVGPRSAPRDAHQLALFEF